MTKPLEYLKEQLPDALAAWQYSNGGKVTLGWARAANPEFIASLLAELAAKDERLAELGHPLYSKEQVATLHQCYERLDKMLAESSVALKTAEERIAELEAKLAEPVQLPEPAACPLKYVGSPEWAGIQAANKAIGKCADAVRAAGFKVKGDA